MRAFFERLAAANWGILEVFLTAASPIDLPRLAIQDAEDARAFVRAYGYQLECPEDAAEVERIRREALSFIQRVLLDTLAPAPEMPALVRYAGVTELLLLASCGPEQVAQRWACAVLRVMHTLSHARSELSLHYFPAIAAQILEPYALHVQSEAQGLWLGQPGELGVPLVDFHVKAGKDRDSTLLKLLHKPENVAADLFDRIGVRFVTRDALDVLLVLHYLREKHLVAFPNLKPGDNNTLLDIRRIRRTFAELQKRYEARQISLSDFETTLRQVAALSAARRALPFFRPNPHSSSDYRSVQFTVRQLVRLPLTGAEPPPEAGRQPRFFFPYEIQIVDADTHRNNMEGQASHARYKRRQLETARRRVLGNLLEPEAH